MPYYKHGESSGGVWTAEYISWMRMRQRCLDPNTGYYHVWGGRGIAFDPTWKDFRIFLADMGRRPKGHTLERIDNNLGYSKGNCRWATPLEQAHNRRDNKLTQQDVDYIRKSPLSCRTLGEAFNVGFQMISKIKRGERWPC